MITILFVLLYLAFIVLIVYEWKRTLSEISGIHLITTKGNYFLFKKQNNNQHDTDDYFSSIEISELYPFIRNDDLLN